MRPKKTRWIKCEPGQRYFRPFGVPVKKLETVNLTIDEFEAIRLCDLEALTQAQAAKRMKVHRSTISRIVTSAHKNVAEAFVNIKMLRIEGGCCKFRKKK